MSAATPTSACTPMTRALAVFLIAATASSSASLPRATMATSAPDCAKRVATARPMPLLPPVTMAERPERLISMKRSHDPADWDRAIPSVVGGATERVIAAFLPRHDAVDFLARRCADRLVVEQRLGPAVDRLADQRALEGRVEPAVRIALVGAVGDAPAQVKNSAGLEDGEQAAHRVENLRPAQMHDHRLAQHVVEGRVGHAGQRPAAPRSQTSAADSAAAPARAARRRRRSRPRQSHWRRGTRPRGRCRSRCRRCGRRDGRSV